ncbi:MAG: hypothetical protein MPW13_02085 [Candidatus Manganitrophus sp.]|nr:hypothetical protein [Candidatus Manganitrophus sp.]
MKRGCGKEEGGGRRRREKEKEEKNVGGGMDGFLLRIYDFIEYGVLGKRGGGGWGKIDGGFPVPAGHHLQEKNEKCGVKRGCGKEEGREERRKKKKGGG